MRAVFGETSVNERTSSCEFHIDKNVTERKSHIVKESQEYYCSLFQKLKNAPSINDFEKNLSLLKTLITQQIPGNQNSLREALKFWLKAEHRWAVCYRRSLHGIPLSNLAEAAQASMKVAGGKNLSIIDAVYASVRLSEVGSKDPKQRK